MKTVILIIIGAALFITAALLILKLAAVKRSAAQFTRAVDNFIINGHSLEFSLKEGTFASLQNSFYKLQEMILLERKNSKETAEMNTQFVADVSHQLKTPIAGLRLYCELENAENPTSRTQKEIMLIEKMETLVQNLLKLEKIKSDAYEMEFADEKAKSVADAAVCQIKDNFESINFNVHGDGYIRCDAQWLKEALVNIIKNAAEHSKPGSNVDVNIKCEQSTASFEIQDYGSGVSKRDLSGIFNRFYKAENALPASAGIGLAISKAIVEKHHGIISAQNKNGGLCVNICIINSELRDSI